jgi:hypothetical protein
LNVCEGYHNRQKKRKKQNEFDTLYKSIEYKRRLKNKNENEYGFTNQEEREKKRIISHLFLLIYIKRITLFSSLFYFQYTHQTKCHHASIKKNTKIFINNSILS